MLQDLAIITGTAVAINIFAVEEASLHNSKILSVALAVFAIIGSAYSAFVCPSFYILGIIIGYFSKKNLAPHYGQNNFHKGIEVISAIVLTILTRSGYASAAAGFFASC